MDPKEAAGAVTEIALLVKEYQLAGGDLRETMRAALLNHVESIREKYGEAQLQEIIRRVEGTMNGTRFPDLTHP